VTNALSPARVQRVTVIDNAEKIIEVVVEDRQLSLAIGKKGQNVRLAARLTGWKIDIKSEEDLRREVEAQFDGLGMSEDAATLTLPGLEDEQLRKLSDAGLDTADSLLETSAANLAEVAGVDEATAEQLQAAVREQVAAVEQAAAEATEAAALAEAAAGTEAPEDTPPAPAGDDAGPDTTAATAAEPDGSEPEGSGEDADEPQPGSDDAESSERPDTER
jgi:N utilization substance protein A